MKGLIAKHFTKILDGVEILQKNNFQKANKYIEGRNANIFFSI